jgi:hypothetical protein
VSPLTAAVSATKVCMLMPNRYDTLDSIPALTPDREDIQRRNDPRSKASKPAAPRKGNSIGLGLLVFVCLLAIGGLAAWNYLLHQQLEQSAVTLGDTADRLQVLEGRLMITDESMSQSSDVFQVRLMQLDSEVRKLWDNVWKKAKQRLAEQDKAIKALQADVQKSEVLEAELKQQLVQTRLALEVVEDQVDSRADASEELAVLMGQWDAQQRSLAETSTSLEVLQQANDDTQQRLQGTDEWVDSFNGYRTQINRKLLDLQGAVNALQGP